MMGWVKALSAGVLQVQILGFLGQAPALVEVEDGD
jgi:hypothetical protein